MSSGWKARRLGGLRCVCEGGLTAGGALREDRRTDTSLGWTTERPGQRAVLWMDSIDALPLQREAWAGGCLCSAWEGGAVGALPVGTSRGVSPRREDASGGRSGALGAGKVTE